MGCRENDWPTARQRGLSVCLSLTLWLMAPAWAQTYRWVDERGRVHYSDTRPPLAIEQVVIDKQGRVLRQIPRSGAQMRQSADEGARVRETARERQDRALLSTYVHEGEIDLARDRALAQEQAKRASLQAMLQEASSRLSQLDGEAASHDQAGRRLPDALRQARDETRREIDRLNAMLGRNAQAMDEIQVRYEGYKQRFRELKGLAGATPSKAGTVSAVGNAAP
jgi:hypothetical protein